MPSIMIKCYKCGVDYEYSEHFQHVCHYRAMLLELIRYEQGLGNVTVLEDGTPIYHYGEEDEISSVLMELNKESNLESAADK